MKQLRAGVLIVLVSFLALSCGKKGVPYDENVVTTKIEIVSGNNQIATAQSFLTDSLMIRVMTSSGMPVPNITVTYAQITPESGGHFPTPSWATRTTDTQGIAFTKFYLDTLIGIDTIRAMASGIDDSVVYFVLTVTAAEADTMIKVSPLITQETPGGEPFPQQFIVRVEDRFSNPVAGHRVRYVSRDRCVVITDSTEALGYETDTAYTRTNSQGEAQATWVMTIIPTPGFGYPFSSTMRVYDLIGHTVQYLGFNTDPGQLTYDSNIRPIFAEHCFTCHGGAVRSGDYALDFYYEVSGNGNMTPGDTNSPLLSALTPDHWAAHINTVEEDNIIHWVVTNNAAPGSSGLNNYHDNMKPIFDARCVSCHNYPMPAGGYSLADHAGIRGDGSDAAPNAIPGDSASLLVQKLLTGQNMRGYLGADSVMLADSLIRWIVVDSLRDY